MSSLLSKESKKICATLKLIGKNSLNIKRNKVGSLKHKILYLIILILILFGLLFFQALFEEEQYNSPAPSFVWEGVNYILTNEPVGLISKSSNERSKDYTHLTKGNEIGSIKNKISRLKVPKNNGESNYLQSGEIIFDTKPSSKTEHSFYYALVVKFDHKERIAIPLGRDVIRLSNNPN